MHTEFVWNRSEKSVRQCFSVRATEKNAISCEKKLIIRHEFLKKNASWWKSRKGKKKVLGKFNICIKCACLINICGFLLCWRIEKICFKNWLKIEQVVFVEECFFRSFLFWKIWLKYGYLFCKSIRLFWPKIWTEIGEEMDTKNIISASISDHWFLC